MNRQDEITAVRILCEQIGYGNVMDIASKLWQQDMMLKDLPIEGAHVPCIVTEKHVYTDNNTYVNVVEAVEWWRNNGRCTLSTMNEFAKYIGLI